MNQFMTSMKLLIICLLCACSSQETVKKPQRNQNKKAQDVSIQSIDTSSTSSREQESVDLENAIKYEELGVKSQMNRNFIEDQHSLKGKDAVTMTKISGEEAFKILSQNNIEEPFEEEINTYLKTLLKHPESVAFFYDLPPLDTLPTGVIYIPWPSETPFGLAPDRPGSKGIVLDLGIGVEKKQPKKEALNTPKSLKLNDLSPSSFAQMVSAKESFLVFISAQGCGSSAKFESAMSKLLAKESTSHPIYRDPLGKVTGPEVQKIIQAVLYPILIHYEKGTIGNIYIGTSSSPIDETLRSFLIASNVLRGNAKPVRMKFLDSLNAETIKRRVSVLNHWPYADYSGLDLSGVRLVKGSVSGASFEGSDLSGADFRRAFITKTNFKNASVKGMKTSGSYFYDVTCPSGKKNKGRKPCPEFLDQ